MLRVFECLSEYYNSLVFAYGLIVISNSLIAFCVSGIAFAIWWRHKPFFLPICMICMVMGISFSLKVIYGAKETSLKNVCCVDALYVILNYTFPSTHVGLAFSLGFHFLRPYMKPKVIQHNDVLTDPNQSLGNAINAMGKWEKIFRGCCVVLYVVLVCLSRIYLMTNDKVDVFAGMLIGLSVVLFAENYLTKLFETQLSTEKTE